MTSGTKVEKAVKNDKEIENEGEFPFHTISGEKLIPNH
jgi:hypothetical protein